MLPPKASASSDIRATKVAVANSRLGRIIVDAKGRTLYQFEKDKNRSGACVDEPGKDTAAGGVIPPAR